MDKSISTHLWKRKTRLLRTAAWALRPTDLHPTPSGMSPFVSEAITPNPHLAAFAPLMGAWKTTGHHALLPGMTLHGRTTFEWHEGGAFVMLRTEIEEAEVPNGMAIFATDDEDGSLMMLYFDERAVSRRYHASMDGNVLRYWREAPSFSQRYALTISDDGNAMHSAGELSRDGVLWSPDLELDYTRLT